MAPRTNVFKKCGDKVNQTVKDLKGSHVVLTYKQLSSKKSRLSAINKKQYQRVLLEEKNKVNYKILEARVLEKTKSLSEESRKKALIILNKIFIKFTLGEVKNHEKFFEFTKEFAKSINRKEGKEVLEILKETSKKYM